MYQVAEFLIKVIEAYTFVLVIYALLSWFPGAYHTSLGRLLSKVCDPYLRLFSRLPLRLGPIDFTVLVAIFVLTLVSRGIILVYSLFLY